MNPCFATCFGPFGPDTLSLALLRLHFPIPATCAETLPGREDTPKDLEQERSQSQKQLTY